MVIEDQASKLRQLMNQARQCRTIAVVSGKGGVGKSNIALNLSILLSAAGNRVALVDADLGLANLDVLIRVDARANLSHVIGGTKRLEDVVINLPSGVQFVPGASGLMKLTQLSEFHRAQLTDQLVALEGDNDIMVVDCGAGIGPNVIHFGASADQVVIVTSPEPTAITDAYAVVKVLAQHNYAGQMSLLVNFVADRHEARATYQRISNVAGQFLAVKVLDGGYILTDPKVTEAVRRREALVLAYPRCPASRCIGALATKLSAGGTLISGKGSFFKRVANWFA